MKTKLISLSVILLVVSGLAVVPNVYASEIDLTLEEKIDRFLRDKTDLSEPLILIAEGFFDFLLTLLTILFGEELGYTLTKLVFVLINLPYCLTFSFIMAPAMSWWAFASILDSMEIDLEQLLIDIGVIGVSIFMMVILPFFVLFSIVAYPVLYVITFFEILLSCLMDFEKIYPYPT